MENFQKHVIPCGNATMPMQQHQHHHNHQHQHQQSSQDPFSTLKKGVDDLERSLNLASNEIENFKKEIRVLKGKCSMSWDTICTIDRELEKLVEYTLQQDKEKGEFQFLEERNLNGIVSLLAPLEKEESSTSVRVRQLKRTSQPENKGVKVRFMTNKN